MIRNTKDIKDIIALKKYFISFFKKNFTALLFILGMILIVSSYYISKDLSTTLIQDSVEEFDNQKFLVLVFSYWLSGTMCCLYSIFKK